MRHGIADEEWDNYLMGRSTPETRARLDAHLLHCTECWERYEREYPAMSTLGEAVQEAREQLALEGEKLRPMFAEMMASLRASEPAVGTEINSGLDFLKAVLDPVFGPTTAQRAMHLAASPSSADPLSRVTQENWDGFLERLAAIASIICGDVFAGLIRQHGQLVPAAI